MDISLFYEVFASNRKNLIAENERGVEKYMGLLQRRKFFYEVVVVVEEITSGGVMDPRFAASKDQDFADLDLNTPRKLEMLKIRRVFDEEVRPFVRGGIEDFESVSRPGVAFEESAEENDSVRLGDRDGCG